MRSGRQKHVLQPGTGYRTTAGACVAGEGLTRLDLDQKAEHMEVILDRLREEANRGNRTYVMISKKSERAVMTDSAGF